MKLAIMQPYLFPYIGYWQLINHVDTFVIYDDVNFIKRGYINRNYLLSNGRAHRITLEVIGASQNKKINELSIGDNQDKILKTIASLYCKSPNFSSAFKIIEKILSYPDRRLSKFIGHSLEEISCYLELDTNFVYSSDIKKNNILRGQDKIIEICSLLGSHNYYNSIGGQDIYSDDDFKKSGISLNFIKSKPIYYPQFRNTFVENLSIIDTLMFNDKYRIKKLLEQYEVV